ncbi:uncharacterized protein LOC119112660 isoform X2 [Pollicipes pollicipes]|uniref:uncharacterized protein LOC119112660 isoform X2 n=1 Tax=Pollicipes pollicipes TaxID=41117 RepID=UPI0018850E6D|nr:uncharacterized protein LOC119112660 isoform X2 [Pollicipes pollicipes]
MSRAPRTKCQQHGDVYVCARVPPPTCAATSCPSGFECVLQQALCDSLPCNPRPYCVRSNPCGICIAPDEFCELLPVPFCRRVVEPTCANKICPHGQKCREEAVACFRPPCPVDLVCD